MYGKHSALGWQPAWRGDTRHAEAVLAAEMHSMHALFWNIQHGFTFIYISFSKDFKEDVSIQFYRWTPELESLGDLPKVRLSEREQYEFCKPWAQT